MKIKQEILNEIIEKLRKERKELWVFYHEAQLWKEQIEVVKPYDEIINILELLQ